MKVCSVYASPKVKLGSFGDPSLPPGKENSAIRECRICRFGHSVTQVPASLPKNPTIDGKRVKNTL
jgi:hypothetical protein